MARSGRSGGGGRSAPTRTAPRQTQQQQQPTRSSVPANTAQRSAAPAAHAAPPAQVPATMPQSQGPGIFGQIAANAASIAAGSTIARGMSHAMGWDGHSQSAAPADPQPQDPQTVNSPYAGDFQSQSNGFTQDQQQPGQQCQLFAQDFAKCLQATNNDVSPCQYFLDQFRACQATSTQ